MRALTSAERVEMLCIYAEVLVVSPALHFALTDIVCFMFLPKLLIFRLPTFLPAKAFTVRLLVPTSDIMCKVVLIKFGHQV